MSLVSAWARAFALTLIVELVVAVPLLGGREPRARRITAVVLAQLLSHPAVWFIFPRLPMDRLAFLVLAEAWAVGIEIVFYRMTFVELSWSRALAISALANGASFAAGTLLH